VPAGHDRHEPTRSRFDVRDGRRRPLFRSKLQGPETRLSLEDEIRLTAEIRVLTSLGLTTQETRPFLDCLRAGHNVGDDCPESLAAYQHKIDGLDGPTSQLTSTRDVLVEQLHTAARRGFPVLPNRGDAPDAARRRRSAR